MTIAVETSISLDELLLLLEEADEVLLTRNDLPLAKLVSLEEEPLPLVKLPNGTVRANDDLPLVKLPRVQPEDSSTPRVGGQGKGRIWTSDDFNDPLLDEFWFGEDEPAP